MKYVITIILLLLATAAVAQVTEEWVARYDGTGGDCTDFATAVALDSVGNVYVTGSSVRIGSSADLATVKYDSGGNLLWARRYNGPGDGEDRPYDMAVDREGNVYVTGRSVGWNTLYDYATIKYDSDGNTLWVARYNGSGNGFDFSYAVALDGYGNVYVTGSSLGGGLRNDCVTVKYDGDGNQIWVGRYDGVAHNDDWGEALLLDHRGHIYVTGCSVGSGTSGDYVTIKYDCGGNQIWAAGYNGRGNDMDVATALDVDLEGNLYVTGWSYACSTECDIATIKYDSDGNELWVARYNGMTEGDYVARDLAVDASGNILVTGYFEADSLHTDYATIKYRTDGHQLWVARYNGPGNMNDGACAVAVDEFGGVYVTGGSKGSDANWDYATIKYGMDGNQVWEIRYNGPGDGADVATALTLDARGNVYVTGRSLGSGTRYDYATIKYSQQTGVKTDLVDNQLPPYFRLTCQPNPFNAITRITYCLPEAGEVILSVYNLGGQSIETLVRDLQEPGEYEVLCNAADCSSGIYFCKLTAGDYTETRRMTLLK